MAGLIPYRYHLLSLFNAASLLLFLHMYFLHFSVYIHFYPSVSIVPTCSIPFLYGTVLVRNLTGIGTVKKMFVFLPSCFWCHEDEGPYGTMVI